MVGPTLSRIEMFPVKSLDGKVLQEAVLLPSGALKGDRQYAILDARGRFVNGKHDPLVHRLRATFSEDLTTITLGIQGFQQRETFSLAGDRAPLERWLSEYFDRPVTVRENTETGFPDDLNAPGPTLVTAATLKAVAEWFPNLDLAEIRRRFRTNLEVGETAAFWEERLYDKAKGSVPFRVGAVTLLGINPCQRCIVPTRDSSDGTADRGFQQQFVRHREAQLPPWADRERFDRFYKLAVNTRLAPDTQTRQIGVGDRVELLAGRSL
ncbi:MOSC domain-containing protein [Altericista sp. CCNU0014]|uniref:MOSC domain-containing protein n=1 Tax=Altericista sp. CCNU0014 TaxID=3082949 RepID=UPI00384BBC95